MHTKRSEGWLKHWDFELLDLIMIELAFILAYLLRHHGGEMIYQDMYIRLSIVMAIVDIAITFFAQNYKGIIQRRWFKELIAVVEHTTLVYVAMLVYAYVTKEAEAMSRTVFLLGWGIAIVLCFAERIILKRFIRYWISREKRQSRLLLISTEDHANKVYKTIIDKDYRDYKVCCIAIPNAKSIEAEKLPGVPLICGRESLIEYIRQDVVDEAYIDTLNEMEETNFWTRTLLDMGVTVNIGIDFISDEIPNKEIKKIGEATVITTSIKTIEMWKLVIKRFTDIIGSIIGLIFTGIFFLIVAPQIKHASPGPVFFSQERVGRNGRIFKIYKFRSMYMDAEKRKQELMEQNEMNGFMFKMENDPRIIGSQKGPGKGIGNFIRKTSIDEFPQFFNVLRGDMSLVGTRPPTKAEFEQYDLNHKVRLSMKPGITGIWQTSGRSEIKEFEDVVKMDRAYVENWSLLLDIKLLFKTIKVVFSGEGSK